MKRKKEKSVKEIVNLSIRTIIIIILIFIVIDENKEKKAFSSKNESNYNTENLGIIYETQNNLKNFILENHIQDLKKETQIQKSDEKLFEKEKIIDTYKGYDIIAKLEIPKINLETYVIGDFSVEILNVSVSKFWGSNPNEIGNCCIAGHNFRNKNMFHNLKKLEIGDKCYLTNNKTGKIEYEVYNIYTVSPQNVDCLSQNTINKEITLITCTNDSKNRIIVKAKEI